MIGRNEREQVDATTTNVYEMIYDDTMDYESIWTRMIDNFYVYIVRVI